MKPEEFFKSFFKDDSWVPDEVKDNAIQTILENNHQTFEKFVESLIRLNDDGYDIKSISSGPIKRKLLNCYLFIDDGVYMDDLKADVLSRLQKLSKLMSTAERYIITDADSRDKFEIDCQLVKYTIGVVESDGYRLKKDVLKYFNELYKHVKQWS